MQLVYAHGAAAHAADFAHVTWWDWTLDPTFLVPLLLALLYLRGYRRYRRLGGWRFPRWRVGLLLGGVLVAALALLSPLDAMADISFVFHMVQHQLLMMVSVPLILLGAPFVPSIRGLPRAVRQGWFVPFALTPAVRATVRLLTRPLVGSAAFVGVLVLWHMPYLYDAALFNETVHILEHFTFVVAALLFWWKVVTPYPFPATLHPLLRMAMLFAASIPNNVLGALITFAEEPLYGYRFTDGFWGLSTLQDQQLGGLLMWVMGGMMFMLALTVVFIVYAHEELRKEPRYLLAVREGKVARPA
ncbi:MAG: cytochrome c oxidase assembly protein [Candidatus Lambdaproteobacteria bacterium]|nr:cytochrome c oxidase assembly protein [Candidatus Lambdaproteobacteria bacterium]